MTYVENESAVKKMSDGSAVFENESEEIQAHVTELVRLMESASQWLVQYIYFVIVDLVLFSFDETKIKN